MVGWNHRLNGHGFEWTLGVGDGQGGLARCNSWGREESDMTEQLNRTAQNSDGKESACSRSRFDPWLVRELIIW